MTVSNCPACGSASFEATGPQAPRFSAVVDGEGFQQPDYSIRECVSCGLLYRSDTLSPADFARYYARVDFRGWERPGYYPTERCILETLRAFPKGSRILDFGCSSGRLLAGLCADHQCHGIEVNAAAASEAARKGIRILPAEDLENASLPPFDAIVLVDVFEHMAHPLELLRKLTRALSSGGQLIICTGNGDAAACRRDPAQFWYFRTLEHVCMLTRRHSQFLCSSLRLKLSAWTTLSHYDLSGREQAVQIVQNFMYWQFRKQTLLARLVLRFLPGMKRLKAGDAAPLYSRSRDHVVAVFEKI